MQRDLGSGDGYIYDLTEQITTYQQNGTVNLGNGTVSGGTSTALAFDGCGNRTSKNGGGTYATDSLNCATTFDGATLGYTPNGNLWTYNNWTFTYDAQNRLTNAFLPGTKGGPSTNLDFYYDAKNRQIARNANGVITFSVWDDWELVEEYGTGNVVTAKFLQGAHGPVKSLLNAIYFYQDSLGSTSHIASSTGALLEYYKYDLYGKPTFWDASGYSLPNGSNNNVRDLFAGERWISDMSMYDLRNRFYSPDLGRFAQPDPIGFKGDASNLYRYCSNDWANRTDPMGTQAAPLQAEMRSPEDNYDPNHISGCGNGQFDKMQSMGAIQVSQRMQAHSVEVKKAEAISVERERTIEKEAMLAQGGESTINRDPTFVPGQKSVDDAMKWVEKTHSELHPKDYKFRDGKLPDGVDGRSYLGGKSTIDTQQHYSQRDVMRTVVHELIHQNNGVRWDSILRHLIPQYELRIEMRAMKISREYKPNGE